MANKSIGNRQKKVLTPRRPSPSAPRRQPAVKRESRVRSIRVVPR
jgi:hypothetical protein